MITGAQLIADLERDLSRYETSVKPRALQVETGGSGLYGCIAEAMFRLRGTKPQERLSWDAFVGSAIHEALATTLPKVRDGLVVETRFVYKQVPFTADYLDTIKGLYLDWKTREDSESIVDLISDGPPDKWLAQVHGGAAGAREAGYDVKYVAIVMLPRSGDLSAAQVFGPYEFDQQLADEAVAWSADVDLLAADETADPRDHRGQPAYWCNAYCPFVIECRGNDANVDLEELAVPGEAYRLAQDDRDAAIERMQSLRPMLLGAKGHAGAVTISTSQGSVKEVEIEDIDRMRALAEFVEGSVPMKTVEKRTSSRLTVKWAKTPSSNTPPEESS